jgi:hypothetical protein
VVAVAALRLRCASAVYRFEDGKIRRRQAFIERIEALEAAGLAE